MPVNFPNSPAVDDTFDANQVRYQWDGVKWVARGHADPDSAVWLPLQGGAMVGPLYLAFDPTLPLEAATKQYVDAMGVGGGGGIPDAPSDGLTYGRKDAAWVPVGEDSIIDAGPY